MNESSISFFDFVADILLSLYNHNLFICGDYFKLNLL